MQAQCVDVAEACVTRSFLFVPADSERKLSKAADCDADALILDLEDSVSAENREQGRQRASEFLASAAHPQTWVRINPLNSSDALEDLRVVVPASPRGIVLPKPERANDAIQLGKLLDALEVEHGLSAGAIRILPIATEHPAALFHLHEYQDATPRLEGITWGAEDLAAAIGASANRDDSGQWLGPFELARSLCLLAAAAAGVPAIDTVYTDFRNTNGLAESARAARRDGFAGKLAIHPDQVPLINDAFRPTADELDFARRVVAAFEENANTGVIAIDGQMIDRPHWLQAKRILAAANLDTSPTGNE